MWVVVGDCRLQVVRSDFGAFQLYSLDSVCSSVCREFAKFCETDSWRFRRERTETVERGERMEPARKKRCSPVWQHFDLISPSKVSILYYFIFNSHPKYFAHPSKI